MATTTITALSDPPRVTVTVDDTEIHTWPLTSAIAAQHFAWTLRNTAVAVTASGRIHGSVAALEQLDANNDEPDFADLRGMNEVAPLPEHTLVHFERVGPYVEILP